MAYFPETRMPKLLRRETSAEVDNSPSIYNARDYNIHHRELLAIEKFLVGSGLGDEDDGVVNILIRELEVLREYANNGLMAQYVGSVIPGETIVLPTNIPHTTNAEVLGAADTTIAISSADGFPEAGYVTKFNTLSFTSPTFTFGKTMTSQEIISYTGITPAVGVTPAMLTGCTRALEGTTAQAAAAEDSVIMAGRASLMLGLKTLSGGVQTPNEAYAFHDALLEVTAAVLNTSATQIDQFFEVSYALSIVGSFDDVRVSQFLG